MEKSTKQNRFFSSNAFKAIMGFVLILILLMPMNMVNSLIRERQCYHDEVSESLSQEWGSNQSLKGPFLSVPYTYYYTTSKGKVLSYKGSVIFLPNDLNISGNIQTEPKHRGIYNFIVYKGKINISGNFQNLDVSQFVVDNHQLTFEEMHWSKAKFIYYLSELKGVSNALEITWNDKKVEAYSSTEELTTIENLNFNYEGFYCDANYQTLLNNTFNFTIDLKGSKSLNFIPLGKNSKVNIKSNWPHPKFEGSTLSDTNHVDEQGFSAEWNISHLNRPIKHQWLATYKPNLEQYQFGVTFIEPVDKYQKTIRSTKYSILFILLSFLTLFFVEVFLKKDSNIVQYILIGLALILFYSLLLSLTEQMSFNMAYLISAGAIIGLISVYSHSIYKRFKTTMILFSLWSILYGFLFSILQLEDYALLVGNIGLFIILAVIMFTSKKLNFSAASKVEGENNGKAISNDKGDLL